MKPTQLIELVAELAARATGDFVAEDLLTLLCDGAVRVFDVDDAGVMISRAGRNVFVHATSAGIVPLEREQELMQTGPCADAIAEHRPVVVDALSATTQWPGYAALARECGVRSVAAIPLLGRAQGWGVLDLYRSTAGSWSEQEIGAARLLADIAVSYLVMAHDRDQSEIAHSELVHRASHDELTGLPTRTVLIERLDAALGDLARHAAPVAVLFIDVDRFKSLNDSFGHAIGDQVLAALARRIGALLHSGESLTRFAGDEFVLVCTALPRTSHTEFAARTRALAAEVRAAVGVPLSLADIDMSVSASIGVSIAGTAGHIPTSSELIADADSAMYSAKRAGLGRTMVHDHTSGAAAGYANQLHRDLAHVLERGELVVHYQPIVDARTRRHVAVEALMRWNHPEHGLISAATFIDIAVRSGVIVSLGLWVIDETCRQMSMWHKQFGEQGPEMVYLNFSAPELAHPGLADAVATALLVHGLDASQVGIEIVEDDLADDVQRQCLDTLRSAGHPLSIDDFGTGYSSLSRLMDMRADRVKIDRSLVVAVSHAARNLAVINAIVKLASALEMDVVAEGIETAAQAAQLAEAGCALLQGYWFGRPQPPAQIETRWR